MNNIARLLAAVLEEGKSPDLLSVSWHEKKLDKSPLRDYIVDMTKQKATKCSCGANTYWLPVSRVFLCVVCGASTPGPVVPRRG